MDNASPKHFVYGLVDPRNGELRYVGKSSIGIKRPRVHQLARGRVGRTKKDSWLKSMYSDGATVPSIIILRVCANDVEVLAHEVLLIALFRNAGFNLTNLTDGGDGSSGHKQSPETVAKRLSKTKGMKRTPEFCDAIRKRMLGKPFPPEAKEKQRIRRLGTTLSSECRMKMSLAHKGKKFSDEHKHNLSIAAKNRKVKTNG